jgi:hypothetical protein
MVEYEISLSIDTTALDAAILSFRKLIEQGIQPPIDVFKTVDDFWTMDINSPVLSQNEVIFRPEPSDSLLRFLAAYA